MSRHRHKTDALVIGSGIAGCMTALTLAERGVHVTLITAGESLFSGNTRLAQGGIVYKAVDEKPSDLVSDIVTAGWRRNHVKAVRHLAKHGPEILKKTLIDKYGVEFMRQNGDFRRIREGGHSKARILFCADHTGKSIMERLALAVEESPNISVLTGRTAIDLLTTHHHARSLDFKFSLKNTCVGAYVHNARTCGVETFLADFTVMATGGAGQVFLHTTNTPSSIGSGLAMAYRAKARTIDAEYVQFHPTAMYQRKGKSKRRFLISEALRGEGARLINSEGEAFMERYDDRGDLAPRDIVTRAIMDELLTSGDDCVFLDATKSVDCDLKTRFPTIYENCLKAGVDMSREAIPVVPAAHYFCGGVLVDQRGRTTLERLYAAGECSCTGVHGANRLASTSLLEGILWGWSAAEDIYKRASSRSSLSKKLMQSIPEWECPGHDQNEDPALIAQDWAAIRHTTWNYVGIVRSSERLARAFSDLRNQYKNLQDFYKKTPITKPIIDLFHGCQTAYIITMAAMRNKDSVGCHHRVD